MTDLFDTKEKKAAAVLHFRGLKEHEGWKLLEKIINQNIEVLTERLQDGKSGETIEDIKRLREQIAYHKKFIATPDDRIKEYTQEEQTEPTDDPY